MSKHATKQTSVPTIRPSGLHRQTVELGSINDGFTLPDAPVGVRCFAAVPVPVFFSGLRLCG
jgi:hypothetical protein